MSKSYEDYEQDYQNCLQHVRNVLANKTSIDRDIHTLRECIGLLDNAKQYVIAMQGMAEINSNTYQIQQSNTFLQREIQPLYNEIQRTIQIQQQQQQMQTSQQQNQQPSQQSMMMNNNNTINEQRTELFSSMNTTAYNNNNSDYINTNNSMLESLINNSDDLLRDTQAVLNETEQISTSTLHTMGYQREQLLNAGNHLQTIQNTTIQAKNILVSMSKRAFKNKLSLYCMILLLAFLNCFVIYRIYVKKYSHNENDNDDSKVPP